MLCSGRMGQVCVNIGKLSEREVIIKLGTYGWRVSGRLNLDRGSQRKRLKGEMLKEIIGAVIFEFTQMLLKVKSLHNDKGWPCTNTF